MIKPAEQDIRNFSLSELSEYLTSIGEKPFRSKQITEWLYHKQVEDFSSMKNLPDQLRKRLSKDFSFLTQKILKEEVAEDGTTKILFECYDKERIETVLIPTETRATVCVSTQAGCKFGCRFCASGVGGWTRNLSTAEIINQVMHMKRLAKKRPLSHIVFMGVGEPLDNYDNLIKAIRLINSKEGLNIGARRITISTCGLVPKIKQLAKEGRQIELAISLHGYNDKSRDVLMPVNKKYPVKELIAACREYNKATKRQITFEYILIKDITCTIEAANELGKLLKGLLCKMNLIPYNPVAEFDHQTPTRNEMFRFKKQLEKNGVHATIRLPRGRDVSAACGQLRHTSK